MNNEVKWIHLLFRGDKPPRSTFDNLEDQEDDDYLIEFKKNDLVAISVPVLEYEFINLEELSRLLKDSVLKNNDVKHSTGLIITSPRAVEAIKKVVESILSQQECDKIFSGLKQELILVVGEVSGEKCFSELGIDYNRDAAKAGNGRALVDYIDKNLNKTKGHTFRLIYPKSSRSDDTIESFFQNSSIIDVKSIVSYETKLVRDLETILNEELAKLSLITKGLVGRLVVNLIFFSPSGLESFLNIDQDEFVRQLESNFSGYKIELRYSSIGKTTEAVLLRNRLNVYCVSERPNAKSLVESILLKGVSQGTI